MGIINVNFTGLGRIGSHPSRVMSIVQPPTDDSNSEPMKARVEIRPTLSFSDEDKVRTI